MVLGAITVSFQLLQRAHTHVKPAGAHVSQIDTRLATKATISAKLAGFGNNPA
jgi:hypothetical protein